MFIGIRNILRGLRRKHKGTLITNVRSMKKHSYNGDLVDRSGNVYDKNGNILGRIRGPRGGPLDWYIDNNDVIHMVDEDQQENKNKGN